MSGHPAAAPDAMRESRRGKHAMTDPERRRLAVRRMLAVSAAVAVLTMAAIAARWHGALPRPLGIEDTNAYGLASHKAIGKVDFYRKWASTPFIPGVRSGLLKPLLLWPFAPTNDEVQMRQEFLVLVTEAHRMGREKGIYCDPYRSGELVDHGIETLVEYADYVGDFLKANPEQDMTSGFALGMFARLRCDRFTDGPQEQAGEAAAPAQAAPQPQG